MSSGRASGGNSRSRRSANRSSINATIPGPSGRQGRWMFTTWPPGSTPPSIASTCPKCRDRYQRRRASGNAGSRSRVTCYLEVTVTRRSSPVLRGWSASIIQHISGTMQRGGTRRFALSGGAKRAVIRCNNGVLGTPSGHQRTPEFLVTAAESKAVGRSARSTQTATSASPA